MLSARLRHLVPAAALVFSAVFAAPVPSQAQGLPDFTDLVEKVGPAVVNIRTTERVRSARAGPNSELEEEMRRFFGVPSPGRPAPRPGQPEGGSQQRGVGSGFILNADGYVLTNAHVIEGADEVIVTLTDKREFKARTIGADKRSDVALVKIEASGLPALRIGDSSKLKVGEWVIAIGSPFNLENTVTAGIVSAKARETGDAVALIQTDVAINPGNSGGPLINMRGEVVGINSQIYSRSGNFAGVSFAIPIDEAARVSEQLRTRGRVVRGKIGVVIEPVTRDVAELIGLGKPTGALVNSVESGGPAEKAGVESGDIVTRVDGRVIESSVDLRRADQRLRPGYEVRAPGVSPGRLPRSFGRFRRARARAGRRHDAPGRSCQAVSVIECPRPLGLGSWRGAEARAQASRWRSGRIGRRRGSTCRPRRKRRDRDREQRRGGQCQAVRPQSWPRLTSPSRSPCWCAEGILRVI